MTRCPVSGSGRFAEGGVVLEGEVVTILLINSVPSLTVVGVVEVSDLLPAVEANRVDNRLVVVGSHARGKVQGARGGRQDLEGRND